MKINFEADIISNQAIGNIMLNDNINNYIQAFYDQGLTFTSEKFFTNKSFVEYVINNGIIKVTTNEDGLILAINCNHEYKGIYNKSIGPGINMKTLLLLTDHQKIINECIIVNNDYGLYFIIPSPYDQIADNISQIPLDLRLNYIQVENIEWWVKPELTPSYAK